MFRQRKAIQSIISFVVFIGCVGAMIFFTGSLPPPISLQPIKNVNTQKVLLIKTVQNKKIQTIVVNGDSYIIGKKGTVYKVKGETDPRKIANLIIMYIIFAVGMYFLYKELYKKGGVK